MASVLVYIPLNILIINGKDPNFKMRFELWI